VEYIRDNYVSKSVTVDAIVAPDKRGYLFAFAVAVELDLPYFRIQEARRIQNDDLIETEYRDREDTVNFLDLFEIRRLVVLSP